eukprot:COSAG02_NODE_2478_length_8730_cov_2.636079_1_plen_46_part_10
MNGTMNSVYTLLFFGVHVEISCVCPYWDHRRMNLRSKPVHRSFIMK